MATFDMRDFKRGLDQARKDMRFAAVVALTRTGQDMRGNAIKRAERDLDRPTPFTKRGFRVKAASKRELIAGVYVAPIQEQYLLTQTRGGVQRPKKRALITPANTRLNQYGNVPKSAFARAKAKDDTFSGEVRGVGGLWRRPKKRGGKRGLKLLFTFASQRRHAPRLRYFEAMEKTARARLPIQMRRAFDQYVNR